MVAGRGCDPERAAATSTAEVGLWQAGLCLVTCGDTVAVEREPTLACVLWTIGLNQPGAAAQGLTDSGATRHTQQPQISSTVVLVLTLRAKSGIH